MDKNSVNISVSPPACGGNVNISTEGASQIIRSFSLSNSGKKQCFILECIHSCTSTVLLIQAVQCVSQCWGNVNFSFVIHLFVGMYVLVCTIESWGESNNIVARRYMSGSYQLSASVSIENFCDEQQGHVPLVSFCLTFKFVIFLSTRTVYTSLWIIFIF